MDLSVCAEADALNLGAGDGRWLLHEARRLGVEHPVGIERNPRKVARARAAGLPVYEADFMQLDPGAFPNVKIVVFDNVLEHLPTVEAVAAAVELACAIASHVVYIRHPSFEHREYLASIGLKQYWTDWPGVHTAPLRLHELVAIAAANGVYNLSIRPKRRAHGSDDPTILPLSAPPNQHKSERAPGEHAVYDAEIHGAKPAVVFDRPVYFAFDLFLFLRSDAPTVDYQADTDGAGARPVLHWPDRAPRRRRGLARRGEREHYVRSRRKT